ncbi:MAG: hypothetical protein H7A46_01385 [Verrucomicrobiales bacterium]|nr:hypothetical protein [Verrucomicrobiales bacterium]
MRRLLSVTTLFLDLVQEPAIDMRKHGQPEAGSTPQKETKETKAAKRS